MGNELSIPIKHQKTCLPSTHFTVHGIELDTIKWEARLPGDKVKKMQSAIERIRKCRSISLRQLQSTIGLSKPSHHHQSPICHWSTKFCLQSNITWESFSSPLH